MANENIVIFDQSNFDKTVSSAAQPVLVDFWAAWCGPCRAVAPVIEQLALDYAEKAIIGKVNVDEQGAIAQKFGIMSIPTVILFKNGKAVETLVGLRQIQDYKKAIDQYL